MVGEQRPADRDRELQFTRLRIEELRRRSLELDERNQELGSNEQPGGSSLDHVRRAAERAEQAKVNAAAAHERAAMAYLRSAAAHESAAECHERLAASEFGDVEEHWRRAREHRDMSADDRQAATRSSDSAAARNDHTGESVAPPAVDTPAVDTAPTGEV